MNSASQRQNFNDLIVCLRDFWKFEAVCRFVVKMRNVSLRQDWIGSPGHLVVHEKMHNVTFNNIISGCGHLGVLFQHIGKGKRRPLQLRPSATLPFHQLIKTWSLLGSFKAMDIIVNTSWCINYEAQISECLGKYISSMNCENNESSLQIKRRLWPKCSQCRCGTHGGSRR